jgi:long-chain acyl-CoA synthetase
MDHYPFNPVEKIRDLKELTDYSTQKYADKDAYLILTGRNSYKGVKYRQFGEELCALANALMARGWAGARMALVGENSYEWVLAYFSIVNTNSTAVPLDKELTADELKAFVLRAGVTVLFISPAYAEEAQVILDAAPGLHVVSLGEGFGPAIPLRQLVDEGFALLARGEDRYSGIEIDRERPCAILFTSGTTGASKGVLLCHRNFAANTVAACQMVLFKKEDVMLSLLPINHAYECVCGIFGPMLYGSTVAFCPGVKHLPDCLKLFKPTVMVLVPLYVETFHKRIWEKAKKEGKEAKLKMAIRLGNLAAALGINIREKLLRQVREAFGGRLRLVVSGGAYMNPKLIKAYREFGVVILHGYGATECSPIITAKFIGWRRDKSVGVPLPCCEVKIDEDGQILIRGESVFLGYLDDEEGTAEAFDGDWYKSGDLGYKDKDGFIYVTGRSKDMIVLKNGKNIMPVEIENLLQQSPLIAEALVKEAPGDENGSDRLMAIIYPEPAKKEELGSGLHRALQQEIDNVNKQLAAFKQIRLFALRDTEFPKTTTRKIKRYQVIFGKGSSNV